MVNIETMCRLHYPSCSTVKKRAHFSGGGGGLKRKTGEEYSYIRNLQSVTKKEPAINSEGF